MKPVGTCEHIPRSATMNEIKYKLTETLKTSHREADDVLEIILEKARPICCSLQVKLIKWMIGCNDWIRSYGSAVLEPILEHLRFLGEYLLCTNGESLCF